MKKFPQKWIDVLTTNMSDGMAQFTEHGAKDILKRLSSVNALKDPPKPREWWVCDYHEELLESKDAVKKHDLNGLNCDFIHVREVLEDE